MINGLNCRIILNGYVWDFVTQKISIHHLMTSLLHFNAKGNHIHVYGFGIYHSYFVLGFSFITSGFPNWLYVYIYWLHMAPHVSLLGCKTRGTFESFRILW